MTASTFAQALGHADFHFYDTAAKRLLPLPRPRGQELGLYACGLTPYAPSHLGHGRSFVVFDALSRTLRAAGWPVRLVRNRTDIDDKIIAAAAKAGMGWQAWSDMQAGRAHDEFEKMGVLPHEQPRVSMSMDAIVDMIAILEQKGHAYIGKDGTVWFDTASFSGTRLYRAGASRRHVPSRVAPRDRRSPEDFALWKPAKPGEPFWSSPWGLGRPGWHIECSAMIRQAFGGPVDIHGGGVDLRFPHHQAEILQSEAAFGEPLAHRWFHHGAVLVNGKKMAKSEGNGVLLADALAQADLLVPGQGGEVLRLALLSVHWQQPLDWNASRLPEAARRWERWRSVVDRIDHADPRPSPEIEKAQCEAASALADNFNTPLALAILDRSARRTADPSAPVFLKQVLDAWGPQPAPRVFSEPESAAVQAWLVERAAARSAGNWELADALRSKILAAGFKVEDAPLPRAGSSFSR